MESTTDKYGPLLDTTQNIHPPITCRRGRMKVSGVNSNSPPCMFLEWENKEYPEYPPLHYEHNLIPSNLYVRLHTFKDFGN